MSVNNLLFFVTRLLFGVGVGIVDQRKHPPPTAKEALLVFSCIMTFCLIIQLKFFFDHIESWMLLSLADMSPTNPSIWGLHQLMHFHPRWYSRMSLPRGFLMQPAPKRVSHIGWSWPSAPLTWPKMRSDPWTHRWVLIYLKCPSMLNVPGWLHGVQDKSNSGPGKLPPSKDLSLSTLFWALCPPFSFLSYLQFCLSL